MKLTMTKLQQIIKEELEYAINEADNFRYAGMSDKNQVDKLNPGFEWEKGLEPTDGGTKLKILQDTGNPGTASIFDASGEMVGQELDISSTKWKAIVDQEPYYVDQAMKRYK